MNETDAKAVTQPAVQVCANCHTPGTDTYCGHCGQRHDTHINSVWHFASEATEIMTHADARVWNTLRPLLLQPGFLSQEFFAGRRARYLQPFRLYLILSVVFLPLMALFMKLLYWRPRRY